MVDCLGAGTGLYSKTTAGVHEGNEGQVRVYHKSPMYLEIPRVRAYASLAMLFLLLLPTVVVGSQKKEYFRITAVGDIMMGTTYPTEKLPPEDGRKLFLGVRDSLRGSDIVFGNLEAPFIEEGTAHKCGEDPDKDRHCYEFRMPPRYVAYLVEDGFNAVGVANNHILDFGAEGLTSTLRTLEAAHIQAVGGRKVAHFHIRGKSIALAGFSFSAPPSAGSILYPAKAAEIVKGLKTKNDIVIVSFHGGGEGRKALHVADAPEEYDKEMRGNVVKFSRTAIDAGADMVLGHGPHVLRAMEVYKGKLIAYSLGSFLAYGRFNINGPAGMSAVLKVIDRCRYGQLRFGAS